VRTGAVPTVDGVPPPVPAYGPPAVPAERTVDDRAPAQRAVAATLGVMWGVGVPLLFIIGKGHLWWLVFVPIAVSLVATQYFGRDWNPHSHRRRRR
jgi:hypothetical protein